MSQAKPIRATDVEAVTGQTVYPEPFAQRVAGRKKRKLGNVFGLGSFGVNLTSLEPGAESALLHSHAVQDEFVYILEGQPTLALGEQEYELCPGDCIGFKAGTGIAHQLVNRSDAVVVYLEVGDRRAGEQVEYPRDDLVARQEPDGSWILCRKDGTRY